MRLKNVLRDAFVLICALALLSSLSCKRKGSEEQGPSGKSAGIDLSSSVAAQIPAESFGFALILADSPAYKQLIRSPWGGGNDLSTQPVLASKEFSALEESLKRAGIDLRDKENLAKTFSQTALFIAPGASGVPVFGAVVKSSSEDLTTKVQALRKELTEQKQAAVKVEDVSPPSGNALKITVTLPPEEVPDAMGIDPENPAPAPQPQPFSFFVAADGNTASFSTDHQIALQVLKKQGALPAVLSSPLLKKGTDGLWSADSCFIAGFIDLTSPSFKSIKGPQPIEKIERDLPIQGAVIGMSMKQSPESAVRILYEAKDDQQKEWTAAINSSKSATLTQALPQKLLGFLSVDGQTLRHARDIVFRTSPQPALQSKLEVLDSVGRIGLAARVAPVGLSFLPIPDLMFVFEAGDSNKLVSSVKDGVTTWAQTSGLPPMPWSTKEISGKQIEYLMTPLGMGIFIATDGGKVLVSSTENFLSEALKGQGAPGFLAQSSERVKGSLQNDVTVANIYFDFREIAALAQNMGGVLAAYAPPQPGSQPLITPERVEEIKKLGIFVGSVQNKPGVLELSGYYELPPAVNPAG